MTIQKVNGHYSFIKNGKPFQVNGGTGISQIKELAESGGNTILCWDTSRLESILKEAGKNNVSVIIGLDIPGGKEYAFYNDKKKVTDLFNAYSNLVIRYKDDPSLLAWCLGNELLMPFTLTPTPFYKTFNRILDFIHNIDPNHPVSTSILDLREKNIFKIKWRMPALDFYNLNIYNDIKNIETKLGRIEILWKGPYLIGEWAPDGYWEVQNTGWSVPIENTSTKKAEKYYEFYTKYIPHKDPRFLGSLVFFWGSRQESTYTWFSIFNENGTPTGIMEVLSECWKNTITTHLAPQLDYMLIDSLGARDNIILSAGSTHYASVRLKKHQPDTIRYSWQILKEDWMMYWSKTFNYLRKPPAETGLFTDSTQQSTFFKAPVKEGPYRVFITVYNLKGYCATANTPIYVVE